MHRRARLLGSDKADLFPWGYVMKFPLRVCVVLVSGLALPAIALAGGQADGSAVTYTKDVAPIIYENCASCHRPNQIAPMSLLSYEDARPWARAIKAKVRAREMPPWFADPRFGEFANDTSLTEAEIETLSAWADAGAPRGDGPTPAPPRFSEVGWSHPSGRDPDLVLELPFVWHIDAEGETPNFNVFVPLGFDDAKLVSAVQVLPGNVAATHHIVTLLADLPPGMVLGTGPAWPGGPVIDYALVPDPDAEPTDNAEPTDSTEPTDNAEPTDSAEPTDNAETTDNTDAAAENNGDLAVEDDDDEDFGRGDRFAFGPYIPGVGADVMRPGHARTIHGDKHQYIVWNLHYQATGKPETARPMAGAWFETGTVTNVERSLSLREHTSEGRQLVALPPAPRDPKRQVGQGLNPLLAPIPPHAANWTVTGIGGFREDSTIYSLFLHMHLRGKDVSYVLTYPDGREQVLLRVPNYNFDWQLQYELAQPIKVPAGSTVKAIARYDNSMRNRLNPAPHKEVYWSEQSWDDMFLASVNYSVDRLEKKAESTEGQN